MKKEISLSLIVPVYNRPIEIQELLTSLDKQTNKQFELVIVEDGSDERCDKIAEAYQSTLKISYYYKENTGPGQSRNYGCERASGNYFVFLDSDCILPPHYIDYVLTSLGESYVDCFGGSDRAHESFSRLQKAINYAMTSFLTTGGIRGGGEKLDKFYPRSFNMGFSKVVFESTGGFPTAKFANVKAAGEDIELSIKIRQGGFSVKLLKDAYVYHKRRTNLKQYYKQAYNFGMARVTLHKRNQGALKAVHLLPSLFLLGSVGLIIISFALSTLFLLPLVALIALLFTDASLRNKSIAIGLLSVLTSFIQLIGYGWGFLYAFSKNIR